MVYFCVLMDMDGRYTKLSELSTAHLGAGRLVLVGEDVDRTLSKNQHILNIVPTSPQHPPHPHVLSTRIPRT